MSSASVSAYVDIMMRSGIGHAQDYIGMMPEKGEGPSRYAMAIGQLIFAGWLGESHPSLESMQHRWRAGYHMDQPLYLG